MEREAIICKLNDIFVDVLDLDESPDLNDSISANDIEEWDSLAQVQLVSAIEKAFSIKFTAKEILFWKNVGEMVDSILSKLK